MAEAVTDQMRQQDLSGETVHGGLDIAPKYSAYPDALRREIRTIMAGYKTPSLEAFAGLARQGNDHVRMVDLKMITGLMERMATYTDSIREPDWENLRLLQTLDAAKEGYPSNIEMMDVLPDGRIVTASETSLLVWSDGKPVFEKNSGIIHPVIRISPGGDAIFFTAKNGSEVTINRLDTRTFGERRVTTSRASNLYVTAGGDLITTEYTDSGHVRVRVFDPDRPEESTDRTVQIIGTGDHDTAAVLHNGLMLLNTRLSVDSIGVVCLDPRTGTVIRELRRRKTGFVTAGELPDGNIVIDGTYTDEDSVDDREDRNVRIEVYSRETLDRIQKLPVGTYPSSIPSDNNTPRLFDVTPYGSIVRCDKLADGWVFETWEITGKWQMGKRIPDIPRILRVTHDGKIAVAAETKPHVYIFG